MPRQNMSSPISVLLAGVIVIVMLLASAGAQTSASARRQSSTPTLTPCIEDDSDEYYNCLDIRDDLTATADTLAETADASAGTDAPYDYNDPYAPPGTSAATGTATTTRTAGTSLSGTGTPRGTFTPTPTARSAANSPSPGAAGTPQPAVAPATLTPTAANALTCAPGVPVIISGDGPPHAPLLLYFGERPVGGGSVAANGRFALKLVVGQERAGEYRVTVRVRGTSNTLSELTCSVPLVTPTAVSRARLP